MALTMLKRIGRKLNAVVGIGNEKTLFYEMHSGFPLPACPLPRGVGIQELGNEQLQDFCHVSTVDRESVERRWAAKDKCYLAYLADKIVHYSWVKSSGVHFVMEADMLVPVRPGEFWIYHCWTAEWARGQKIYPGMLVMIVQKYFLNGFNRAHIYTSRTNLNPQRGIERAGFRYSSSTLSLRLGSRWYKSWYKIIK
jgi:hypothetical protein